MARRYPQSRVDQIREAYEEWAKTKYVEGSPTVTELAASLGISKPTLYSLKARGWSYENGHRPQGDRARLAKAEADIVALRRLVEELTEQLDMIHSAFRLVERPNGTE